MIFNDNVIRARLKCLEADLELCNKRYWELWQKHEHLLMHLQIKETRIPEKFMFVPIVNGSDLTGSKP